MTPEQADQYKAICKQFVEKTITERGFSIQSHTVQGETLYSVFDWFKSWSEGHQFGQAEWRQMVLRFIMNGTPVSLSTQLLPYKDVEIGDCVMEFGPPHALAMLLDIDNQMNERPFTKAEYLFAQTQLPNYRAKPPVGYLYMIHIDGTDEYKIGYTGNFKNRFSTYKAHTPPSTVWVVDYLHEANYPSHVEGAIHRILNKFRVHGEWFRLEGYWPIVVKTAIAYLQEAANSWTNQEGLEQRIAQFIADASRKSDVG